MRPFSPPGPGALARVRYLSERTLTAEEIRAALALPLVSRLRSPFNMETRHFREVPVFAHFQEVARQGTSVAEEEDTRALIRWFRRRYPTPSERLAYARRAYRRWVAAHPGPGGHGDAEADQPGPVGSRHVCRQFTSGRAVFFVEGGSTGSVRASIGTSPVSV